MQPRTEKDPGSGKRALTYTNPVFPKSFPDPFVLKFRGEYFAYCTGFAEDGGVFGVLRSSDLVSWREVGSAMQPLSLSPPYYWAPEVTYDNGKFYLYYSVGNETLMEIRVAVSNRPDGGFIDSGHRLTSEEFAIDAHVFIDDDGTRYLFYATDFLEHTHIGTGTVVDRMVDWFTLAGDPRPVTRAKYDWQVYDANRKEKGGVRWHTVEGPAVLKRKGVYYEMFSGGNWKNTTYGVSFATSERIEVSDEWCQFSDGDKVLPILRTVPDVIVGPGHNSVVRGPNNRELFCVYHSWTDAGRVMSIDRMDIAGRRMFVVGATHTAQPAPLRPSSGTLHELWRMTTRVGEWNLTDDVISSSDGSSDLRFERLPDSFLCELSFRCAAPIHADGKLDLKVDSDTGPLVLTIHPASNTARLSVPEDSPGLPSILKLPKEFNWQVDHTLRIEIDCRRVHLKLDSAALNVKAFLGTRIKSFSLGARRQAVAITAGAVTEGFEELFGAEGSLEQNGWTLSGTGSHRVNSGELILDAESEFVLTKAAPSVFFEFAASLRFRDDRDPSARWGLLLKDKDQIFRLAIDRQARQITINDGQRFDLPAHVTLGEFHQLRLLKTDGAVFCYLEEWLIAEVPFEDRAVQPFVFVERARVAIDMIRLTVS